MKYILSFAFFLMFQYVKAKDIIYQNMEQSWELTDVLSNKEYTVITCDITFLTNKAGCMDAHTYDKKGSSIYIFGDFGRLYLIESRFEGEYNPWEMYSGHYEWSYYRSSQKGKVAHARFYFPRIPAGIREIGWHFDGGWADESAPSDKYRTPKFDVNSIPLADNDNSTPQTGWTEQKLKDYWQTNSPSPLEGIYNFIGTSNIQFWGTYRHRLAVMKDGNSYLVIYLHGSSENVWTEGELKGVFSPTATKGVYHVDKWFLDNKMLSYSDFYIKYYGGGITLYDVKSSVETIFMKQFPTLDLEEWKTRNL